MNFRIGKHPIFGNDKRSKLKFSYDGREIEAYENETIIAALLASGERIISRSLKFHRPRGIYSTKGKCGRCLMQVNGIPNVNAGTAIIKEGIEVKSQNTYPSARRDFFSFLNYFDFIFYGGFQ